MLIHFGLGSKRTNKRFKFIQIILFQLSALLINMIFVFDKLLSVLLVVKQYIYIAAKNEDPPGFLL